MSADEEKALGNAALQKKDFETAIKHYTNAIDLDGSNHVYYSNRSAALLSKGDIQKALEDGEACVGLKPDWPKGYARKGAALWKLKRMNDAVKAYEDGLSACPGDKTLEDGLKAVKDAIANPRPAGGMAGGAANPMANLFGQGLIDKIGGDPKMKEYLSDPSFMAKIKTLQSNPNALQGMLGDPRIMEVLSMALGGNVSFGGPGGNDDPPPAAPAPKKEPEPEPEPVEEDTSWMNEEELAKHNNKKESVKRKNEGNDHYKKKEFQQAIAKYDEAIGLDGTNMTFINNKAAVYFSMKEYDSCIQTCKDALEIGKANFAPFEDRAKSLTRMGKCYQKKGDLSEAIESFKAAQLEHHSKDTQRLLKNLELEKKKADKLKYQDPEKAEEAKQRGNDLFRQKKWGEAVIEYEDAVKRNPKDAPIRNNLAAALCKIMDFNAAKANIDEALALDPKYVKAWARKGDIHVLMKENHKALDAYRTGYALDETNKACKDGLVKVQNMINAGSQNMTEEEKRERAEHGMADPEIQSILQDPVIRQVLQDFQQNPKAAQQAMMDPMVNGKIEKLIAAGVLQVGR
mmetsp:Transcript_18879/g.39281  ORF Transcript_18879/g.39281 Transcript_18879/m.39281 type:complete len:572 (+) Transcript_18879:36-1751(+)|eukprot:CAMPEP_0118643818 /NCGR_PEP_ID=MMETSP0785-20121206/6595_1 /TAXON_ID=91992 /ORGANISM="Bolidomonas pacifica, Strain CCMP 1866" /LENGTH=571 /DNA_ID=CAMNT_0006535509 /DNA_START=13 /DNA_END=1728 /DNA_ORIENTATION=-